MVQFGGGGGSGSGARINIYGNFMKLQKIFNAVKKTSYQINVTNPDVDGLAFWQPLKKQLDIDAKAKKFKLQDKILTKYVMNEIAEYTVNAKEEKKLQEHEHFIIQTYRIPLTEKPTIRKIVQLALNIGQCRGRGTKYNKYLKSRTKVTDYISEQDIKHLSTQISDEVESRIYKHLTKWEANCKK